MDEFHDVYKDDRKLTYDEAKRTFFTEGCGVLFGKAPCSRRSTFRGEASAALYDMMPDDLDGVAAMLEDFDIE